MSTPATIKLPRRGLYITLGVIAVLVIAALFTVLNKKWWAKRIFRKYQMSGDPSQNAELLANTPLSQFWDMYFNGTSEKWGFTLRGRNDGGVDMTGDVPEGESAEAAGEQQTP